MTRATPHSNVVWLWHLPRWTALIFVALESLTGRSCCGQMPPLEEFVIEVADAHAKYTAETGSQVISCLSDLADAQMMIGKPAVALETAELIDGIWRTPTLMSCANIYFERTGKLLTVPESFFDVSPTSKIEYGFFRIETAKLLFRLGQYQRAKEYLPDDDGTISTTIELANFSFYAAAQSLADRNLEVATLHIRKLIELLNRHPDRRLSSVDDYFLRLAESSIAAQGDASAKICHQALRSMIDGWLKPEVLMAYNGSTEPDYHLGLQVAKLGRISSLLGDERTAASEFSEALKLLTRARVAGQKEGNEFHDLVLGNYLKPVIQIGTWQLLGGLTESGKKTLRKASNMTSQFVSELSRHAHRKDIAVALGKGGEFQIASQELDLIDSHYWRASILCEWAAEYVARENIENATKSLLRADEISQQMQVPNNSTATLLDIAERWEQLNEHDEALKLIGRAIKISETTSSNKYHQRISYCQVGIGDFEGAYRTIGGINDLRHQLGPMGRLAKTRAERSLEK